MQVVIYGQLVTENVILNDGDVSAESEGVKLHGLNGESLEAEPSEGEIVMNQATSSSSTNKQLPFK